MRNKTQRGNEDAMPVLWWGVSGASGLAAAAIQIAARRWLMFHRADGDGFRFAKLGKQLAEPTNTTRQQNASDTLQVG